MVDANLLYVKTLMLIPSVSHQMCNTQNTRALVHKAKCEHFDHNM